MRLTDYGLVAEFQMNCGCSEEGPSRSCKQGKNLWKAVIKASDLEEEGKLTSKEVDKFVSNWQQHLGA